MAQSSPDASVIKAYWQPGCTSCLRMKEFLTKHGVPFVSVNVLEDKDAFAELAMLGIRSVPIVRRFYRAVSPCWRRSWRFWQWNRSKSATVRSAKDYSTICLAA